MSVLFVFFFHGEQRAQVHTSRPCFAIVEALHEDVRDVLLRVHVSQEEVVTFEHTQTTSRSRRDECATDGAAPSLFSSA